MITNHEQYNNVPQQDKESMIAKAAENSNTNENTIIANTDEVEGLLRTLIQKIDSLNTNTDAIEGLLGDILSEIHNQAGVISGQLENIDGSLTTLNGTCGDTTHEVTTQGQAIVQALGQ